MIRVTFTDQQSRDAFAERFKLDSKVDANQLDIDWHLLHFAKIEDKVLDYDDLEESNELEFVVKGDPAKFGMLATIVEDLGQGFYLVKSTDGTLLGDFVDSIEHNGVNAKLMANVSNVSQLNGTPAELDPTSADAQWHRIRIVSRYRPLASGFSLHNLQYQSKPEVYIIDSGINFSHPEFDYPEFEYENFYTCYPGIFEDDVGHGTAVASMVAGKNLGISSYVKLCNIKIGNKQGTTSLYNIGKALDALLTRAENNPLQTRIVNMSWGTARSSWLDSKIEALQDAGITVICAAGNNGISVEDISPAGIDSVITVASTDKYDIPSGFNDISPSDSGLTTGHGLSLDIFAPGENVMVANSEGGYSITSGTSFSSPLVAGVAAVVASTTSNLVPYDQLKKLILDSATKEALLFTDTKFSDNQNNLVYLFIADTNQLVKSQKLVSYLGIHDDEGNPIIVNMSSTVDITDWDKFFPNEAVRWSLNFLNSDEETTYRPFFQLDEVTGMLTINKPTVELQDSVKLKMIEFTFCADNSKLKAESQVCFFFQSNPKYKDTLEGDITLALTETNSISFYAAWGKFIK